MPSGSSDLALLPTELVAALHDVVRVDTLLVCSDFDGTLAPIAPTPDQARPLVAGIDALVALAATPRTTAALVSGRSRADLSLRVGSADGVLLVGSHGWELPDLATGGLDTATTARRDALRAQVTRLVGTVPGVLLEPKPTGVAVHVRLADRGDAVRVLAAVREAAGHDPDVHLTTGHEVLELSVVETDKGRALDLLRDHAGAGAVVFVGDDTTDEHGFARLSRPDVGVKVGTGPTAAQFRVRDPQQVAVLLGLLAQLRALLAHRPGDR